MVLVLLSCWKNEKILQEIFDAEILARNIEEGEEIYVNRYIYESMMICVEVNIFKNSNYVWVKMRFLFWGRSFSTQQPGGETWHRQNEKAGRK